MNQNPPTRTATVPSRPTPSRVSPIGPSDATSTTAAAITAANAAGAVHRCPVGGRAAVGSAVPVVIRVLCPAVRPNGSGEVRRLVLTVSGSGQGRGGLQPVELGRSDRASVHPLLGLGDVYGG